MLITLKRFLKERKLVLNVDKTKIVVFNRKGKEKKEKWIWEERRIEEVMNFKYLGFMFNNKEGYEIHINGKERKNCGEQDMGIRREIMQGGLEKVDVV